LDELRIGKQTFCSWATRNSSLLKTHGLTTRNTIPDYPSSLSRLLPSAAAPSTRRSHLHTELILLGQPGSSSRWHSGADPEPHDAAAAAARPLNSAHQLIACSFTPKSSSDAARLVVAPEWQRRPEVTTPCARTTQHRRAPAASTQ